MVAAGLSGGFTAYLKNNECSVVQLQKWQTCRRPDPLDCYRNFQCNMKKKYHRSDHLFSWAEANWTTHSGLRTAVDILDIKTWEENATVYIWQVDFSRLADSFKIVWDLVYSYSNTKTVTPKCLLHWPKTKRVCSQRKHKFDTSDESYMYLGVPFCCKAFRATNPYMDHNKTITLMR